MDLAARRWRRVALSPARPRPPRRREGLRSRCASSHRPTTPSPDCRRCPDALGRAWAKMSCLLLLSFRRRIRPALRSGYPCFLRGFLNAQIGRIPPVHAAAPVVSGAKQPKNQKRFRFEQSWQITIRCMVVAGRRGSRVVQSPGGPANITVDRGRLPGSDREK